MVNVKNVKVILGIDIILEDVSFDLEKGQVMAITGKNGSGKTTLLNAVLSKIPHVDGTITLQPDIEIGMIEQSSEETAIPVSEYIIREHPDLVRINRDMRAHLHDPRYADLVNEYAQMGGYALESQIEKYATAFGFSVESLHRPFRSFSEGEKRIWELIKFSVYDYDLIIMDEPTNHLDIRMCVYLEQYILSEKARNKSFLIVSHDRTLLDRVADKTLYIQRGASIMVNGGYSVLLDHLDLQFQSAKRKAEDINRKVKQLEFDALKKKNWAAVIEKRLTQGLHGDKGFISHKSAKMAKRAKISERRQEKLIDQFKKEKPFIEKQVKLSFPEYWVDHRKLITMSGVSFGYDERVLLEDVDLEIDTLDRVAFVGPNGSGKTTLIRILLGQLPHKKGEIYRNPSVRTLYIPQDIRQFFPGKNLIDHFVNLGYEETVIRQFLGAAKIRKEKALHAIHELSYGELSRAALVFAILSQSEFVFMDEPTNHLDIESLEVLDRLLEEFQGGFLCISHDRYFIAKHAQSVYHFPMMADSGGE